MRIQYTPIGKPLDDSDTCIITDHGVDCNYTILIGRYFYPDWNPILPMRIQYAPTDKPLGDKDNFSHCSRFDHGLTASNQPDIERENAYRNSLFTKPRNGY